MSLKSLPIPLIPEEVAKTWYHGKNKLCRNSRGFKQHKPNNRRSMQIDKKTDLIQLWPIRMP